MTANQPSGEGLVISVLAVLIASVLFAAILAGPGLEWEWEWEEEAEDEDDDDDAVDVEDEDLE